MKNKTNYPEIEIERIKEEDNCKAIKKETLFGETNFKDFQTRNKRLKRKTLSEKIIDFIGVVIAVMFAIFYIVITLAFPVLVIALGVYLGLKFVN